MTTIGVICEYNPFHNGHLTQLQKIRQDFGADSTVVCLMSGNYVQRGEPAIFDKSVRARAAVTCGADLVLELPLTCALRSAEGFACGAVRILDALNIEILSFGCETPDSDRILATAKTLLNERFLEELRAVVRETKLPFAAARQKALEARGCWCPIRPNEILAVEYCKAILRFGYRIRPHMLCRAGDYHGADHSAQEPSASALRRILAQDCDDWREAVPPAAAEIYEAAARFTPDAGSRAVLARLRTLTEADFSQAPYGSEGLWRKFMYACKTQPTPELILEATKSKRYARARLQRMLMCCFLGISEQALMQNAPYVRILAFNDRGRAFLQERKHGELPLVNAGQTPPDAEYYALETAAAALYPLFCMDNRPISPMSEESCRIFYKH